MRGIWLVDSPEGWSQIWRRAEDSRIDGLPLGGDASFASEGLADRVNLEALLRNTGL